MKKRIFKFILSRRWFKSALHALLFDMIDRVRFEIHASDRAFEIITSQTEKQEIMYKTWIESKEVIKEFIGKKLKGKCKCKCAECNYDKLDYSNIEWVFKQKS